MADDSVVDIMSDGSDFEAPKAKSRAKVPKSTSTKSTAVRKTGQPKSKPPPKPKATVPKKRVKEEDDESDRAPAAHDEDESLLRDTPPKPKKQKLTSNPVKSPHQKPLAELINENMAAEGESPKANKKKRVSEQYQKLTQLEHIIKRPDTYIGSTEKTEKQVWVFNSDTSSMEYREIAYVPGLFKIFDEILVNAADNKQNDASMKEIRVTIDRDLGEISVQNDGKGIPVEIHSKEKVYIPELIFGHLLAGSNFDDNQQKVTGGRNGYGAKLCNVFSTHFTIETSDKTNKKKYKQTWTENMQKMGKAKITDTTTKEDFTKVTFRPDFAKFGMDGLDDDHEALFKRRVYDLCGTCSGMTVYLNGSRLPVKGFKKYIEMYTKAIKQERGAEAANDQSEIIVEKDGDRWEVGFTVSDGSFQQVSFVNSIATTAGGTHVNYVADQITNRLADIVKKRNKGGAALKPHQIRNHIFIFVNCLVVNPAFSSQTKEQLTTKASQFGSKYVISDEFVKKIAKTDVIANILSFAQQKADQILKKSDGSRRSRMHDPKLVDANKAGTKDGHLCTLILTEGDSAKGMAMAGRAVVGADLFGVFPLRGKLLNVRDASIDAISKNKEIQNIKNFLGLQHKKVYTDTKGLRYGHLMIMTDQDHDGSHIKGLLINFLQVQFPSLLKLPEFLIEFITPIVKVYKGDSRRPTRSKAFYTMPEYIAWKEAHRHERGWEHKYYKGLGTSSTEESQEYFNDLDRHHKDFDVMQDGEEEVIELAFSKKKADERKEWLKNFVPGTFFDYSVRKITYTDFVNKELILFSMADNIRSIPSVIDGFKPTQRKVLYTCFRRNIKKDMKVVELAGLVSGLTAYQHGDVSLQQTIVGLAQSFVGSNNVNCLEPAGQFGTRLQGGEDAASARYIYTRLSPLARKLFHASDEPLLRYNTDDDHQIEPEVYVPVVPLLLINGADGIGTGWSTSIPNHDPEEIVDNLKRRLNGEEFKEMTPWYRGFKGKTTKIGEDKYKFSGLANQINDHEVEITELPVRVWTQKFKERLEEVIKAEKAPSFIKDYKDYNTHKDVHFVIQMEDKYMKAAIEEGFEEKFKLSTTQSTTNMVAFNTMGKIERYGSVNDILEEFYKHRLKYYTLRKDWMLKDLNHELKRYTNQARFIKMIMDGKLVISRKKKSLLIAELKKLNFDAFPKKEDASKAGELEAMVANEDEDEQDVDLAADASAYDYLLGMALWSLTQERVEKLERQIGDKEEEINSLLEKSNKDLWLADLDEFITEWRFQLADENDRQKHIKKGRRVSKKFGIGTARKQKGLGDSDDEDYKDKKPKKAAASKLAGSVSQPRKQSELSLDRKSKLNGHTVYVSIPPKPQGIFGSSIPRKNSSPERKLANSSRSDDDPGMSTRTTSIKSEPFEEMPKASTKPARSTATKSKYAVDSDSDSSNGDSFLTNLNGLVKPSRAPNGVTEAVKGVASKPLASRVIKEEAYDDLMVNGHAEPDEREPAVAQLARRAVAPSRPAVAELSDEEDESIVPVKRPSNKSRQVDSDDDVAEEPVKPKPKTAATKKVNGAAAARAKPVKAPAPRNTVAKPTTQSPASKAYAKRLAKKTIDSDDGFDATVDSLLDSPAISEDDQPVRNPTARPARRAATTTKAKKSYYDDEDDDMDDFIDADKGEESIVYTSEED